MYNQGIEFVRLGARKGKNNIGCCAIDVIQNFSCDPAAPAYQELFNGDSQQTTSKYAGNTNREVFETLLRVGTFSTREMPDHAFICSLTSSQISGPTGKAWLAILKENGFKFLASVNNSVYTTGSPITGPKGSGSHVVHMFMLVRNISTSGVTDPLQPPKEWTAIPEPTVDDLARWHAGSTKLYSASDLPVDMRPKVAAPVAKPLMVGMAPD